MTVETITIANVTGRCRWCQCTHRDPCPEGCGWANPGRTLCTACVEIDRLFRTPAGRRDIVEVLRRDDYHTLSVPKKRKRGARGRR